jgi:hypothetical protein
VAEGNGLLNRRRDKISTEGSNPSLSATVRLDEVLHGKNNCRAPSDLLTLESHRLIDLPLNFYAARGVNRGLLRTNGQFLKTFINV